MRLDRKDEHPRWVETHEPLEGMSRSSTPASRSSTATQSTAPISAHYVDSRSNTPALLSSMQMQAGQQQDDAAETLRELCGILPITSKTSPSSASSMTTKKSLRPGIDDQRFLKRLAAATLSCLRNLKPRDGDKRAVVQARLQELCELAVPGSTMQLFGSTACELHAHGADLDLTLLLPLGAVPSYAKQQEIVRHLAQAFEPLQASGEFTLVEAIDRARVPILKLQHAESKLQCDVSVGNELAVRKTRLLHAYVQKDARAQSLCMIVKYCAPPHASRGQPPNPPPLPPRAYTPLPPRSHPAPTTMPHRVPHRGQEAGPDF